MAEFQKVDEASTSCCHELQVTTALLWSTSSRNQALQTTFQEAHMLRLHCDRILTAARAFSWTVVLDIFDREKGQEQFIAFLRRQIPAVIEQSTLKSVDWKVRILVSKDGRAEVLAAPIVLHPIDGIPPWPRLPEKLFETESDEVCQVLLDNVSISASKFTTHKTSSRKHYDEARSRLGIEHAAPTESEVLLFNEKHEVMEASLCTPYFLRDGVWITPALSSGGNAGVSRRMALEAGLCTERMLQVDELVTGEMVWLSNAVRGFIPGRLELLSK